MVANAIETFNVRLHNTGFTNASIHCMFEDAPPMVGYAATARLRSGEPPMVGSTFHDRADFWNSILKIPSPRILVLEDKDDPPGRGAFVGDMHCRNPQGAGLHRLRDQRRRAGTACCSRDGDSVVCRERRCLARLCPHFRRRRCHHVSAGWKFVQEICCTVTVTEFSRYRRRLPRQFQRSLRKSDEAEQKVIELCRSSDFSVAKLSEVMNAI